MTNHGTTRKMIMSILKEGPATISRMNAIIGCNAYSTLYHMVKSGALIKEGISYRLAISLDTDRT